MKKRIDELASSQKRSLSLSIHYQTIQFMKHHRDNIHHYRSKQDLVNDVFFYWLRNCADRSYLWSGSINALYLPVMDISLIKEKVEQSIAFYIRTNHQLMYDKRLFKQKSRSGEK